MKEDIIIHRRDVTTFANNKKMDKYIVPQGLSVRDMEIILERITQNIPDFHMQSKPILLSGGLLNYVWRIQGESSSIYPSLIVKWAPPFIASNPQIQLDPGRITIEANANLWESRLSFKPDE